MGAYAVQLASHAGLRVYATASSSDLAYVQSLGAATVMDYRSERFEDRTPPVDIVLDTVGGEIGERSRAVVRDGGILVSVVSTSPLPPDNGRHRIRTAFFLVKSPRSG